MEEQRSSQNVDKPLAGQAEVLIVHNVVAQVVFSGSFTEPQIGKQSELDDVEGEGEVVATTAIHSSSLAEDQVLVLVIHGKLVAPAQVEVQPEVVSHKAIFC